MEKSSFDLKYPDLVQTFFSEENILSRAKNIGIKNSSGDFVILIDDDATLEQGFIEKLNNFIDSGLMVLCAQIKDPITGECFTAVEKKIPEKNLRRIDYNFFRGSALIVKKSILQQVGFFNEEFGPGGVYYSAEESDLFFRIKKAKEPIRYVPSLVVYHPVYTELPSDKAYRYSYATGAMLTNNCFNDIFHIHVYIYLMSRLYVICFIRVLQILMFPKFMEQKNKKRQYKNVLFGLSSGVRFSFRRNLLKLLS
jgi:GT2 family glycosyltransferase